MNKKIIPNFKVLALVGAGHANIQVLKHLSMNRYLGLEIVLVNNGFGALYSGMVPGLIEGYYNLEDATIDLPKLCNNSGAILINDHVTKLDTSKNIIYLKNQPPIRFDVLSINVGSESKTDHLHISGKANIIKVKPITNLVKQTFKIEKIINQKSFVNCSIIGGGVASIELSFALKERFKDNIKLKIISEKFLGEKNITNRTKKIIKNYLNLKNIDLINQNAVSIENEYIITENKEKFITDISIISSGAMSLPWVNESELFLDSYGFIKITETLQAEKNDKIFATGDISSLNFAQRQKSGVMAVRQGEILKKNIFKYLLNEKLFAFKPQSNWLYLIGTGNKNAIINWKNISLSSPLIWKMKELIDRSFMSKFAFVKPMHDQIIEYKLKINKKIQDQINIEMKCEGCGSKLSKNTLTNYLEKNQSSNSNLLSDSALISLPSNLISQSIDHIKYFNSMNPYTFGRISYLHSQNDILANGSDVNSFSVSLGLPYKEELAQDFYLDYFMEGILSESKKDNSIFASGHTYTSDEPGVTINMNGVNSKSISKGDANEGDFIFLTKPLGIGYLMSAFMNNDGELNSSLYEKIINNMLLSNKKALQIAEKYQCKVLTDISGFGLASHLYDICKSSNLSSNLTITQEILLVKNYRLISNNKSSAYENNRISCEPFINFKSEVSSNLKNIISIIYDPQTSGPLLISVPSIKKEKFQSEFQENYGFSPIKIGTFIKKEQYAIII